MFFKKKTQKRFGQTLSQKYRAYSKPTKRRRKPVTPKTIPKISRLNYKNKKLFARIKRFLILAVLFSIIISGIYLSFFSSTFLIKSFQIESDEYENAEQELKPFLESSMYKNLFLAKTDEIKSAIMENFPEMEKIQIKKVFPDKLNIKITKSPIIANVINRYENIEIKFLINEKGVLAQKNSENPNLPYIIYQTPKELEQKKQAIDPEKLNAIIDAHNSFIKTFNIKIIDIDYLKPAREARLRTEKGFYARVDLSQNITRQLNKLKLALPQLDIYSIPLEYIDLRIPGTNGEKIFFKRK